MILAIGVPLLIGTLHYDLFDAFYRFSRRQEAWQLDELFMLAVFIGLGSSVFALRRLADLSRESRARQDAESKAADLARQDPLTKLPNRQYVEACLGQLPPQSAGELHALLMLDLDGFKSVNDAYGHAAGDALLLNFADRIRKVAGSDSVVGRLGGDEFAILTGAIRHPVEATRLARKLIGEIELPFSIDGRNVTLGTGIGIALYPDDGGQPELLLRRAAVALDRAKSTGRSKFSFFEEGMDEAVTRRALIENRLRAAISEGLIVPYFQPIHDLQTGAVVAFESLARWQDPDLGAVRPDHFIPVAEDCGLIPQLGDMLLRASCVEALRWPAHIRLSFNLSPLQLLDRALGLKILSVLGELEFDPRRLELEITEGALMRDVEVARETLMQLSNAGITIALDDFGTGHSSLRYIREFHVDKLKIDQSFVRTLKTRPESELIVRAILGLSQGLGIVTTAEGIEDEEHLDLLVNEHCELGQGWLFGKAMSAEEARRFLAQAPAHKRRA